MTVIRKISAIILACIICAACVLPVFAAGINKLYFSREDGDLHFNSQLFDEKRFLNFPSMLPGQTYTDELMIKNETGTDYQLWFKVISFEENPKLFNLLENVWLKVYIDGELLYDGKATGEIIKLEDVVDNGIYIGEFAPDVEAKLYAEATLDSSYNITEALEVTDIWRFWALGDDEPEPLDPPPTGDSGNGMWWILLVIVAIGMGITVKQISHSKKSSY